MTKFLYFVGLEDEIGKFRLLGGRNLNFVRWADDIGLVLGFLMLGVLIQNYLKNRIKKIKILYMDTGSVRSELGHTSAFDAVFSSRKSLGFGTVTYFVVI